jgi:metal-responsive CopG/Arc/MetJ family transcriptional regulator
MKEKTSVTLSRDVLKEIDRLAGRERSRSAVIEWVLREYLHQRQREQIHARDLEILNREADRLNAENEDWLQYQADPWANERE